MAESFLYVISAHPDGPCKIGYSADPAKRLRQLQIGHADLLHLRHSEPVDDDKAYLIEQLVHGANRHKVQRGEWFAMPVDDAVLEVQFAVIRYADNMPLKSGKRKI